MRNGPIVHRRIAMFRRMFPGVSFLAVCLGSIVVQLPTQTGTSSFLGVFGSEMTASMEPVCNGHAPKIRNCRDLNPRCSNTPYIVGPQSVDVGGVNNKRYDPTGNTVECTTSPANKGICPSQPTWSETKAKCTEVMIPWK